MTDLFLQFGAFMTIATAIVIGAVAVYGIWDKKQRQRRKEVDNEEDRLINILEKTVNKLSEKVDAQDADLKELKKKVTDLEHENTLLIKVLQGKDEQTQEFYQKAYDAMKVIHESHQLLTQVSERMSRNSETMSELIKLSARHAALSDHAITSKKSNEKNN